VSGHHLVRDAGGPRRDKSLTDLDNLPEPEDLAEEIIENIEAGLTSLKAVLAGLSAVG